MQMHQSSTPQPHKRTPHEKSKDILIAQMEHKLIDKQNNQARTKKMMILIFIHIVLLSICIPLAIFYGNSMAYRTRRPQHCIFYSLNLKEDFKANCDLCQQGFIKNDKKFGCIPAI